MYFDILEDRCRYQNSKGYYPVSLGWGFDSGDGEMPYLEKTLRPHDTPNPTRILGSNRQVSGEEVALREVNMSHTV